MSFESAALMREFAVYIRLVWLYVVIITCLMLFLCYLYLARRRALARESTSLEFSNLVIEGVETERRRVSRELHDNVLPQVYGTEVYDTVREICMELMPPDFSRFSLNDALVDIGDKFIRRTGLECVISVDKELDFTALSEENQLHLYRMVQEALTNIEKHAKAAKAFLVARRNAHGAAASIVICVSDDGQGLQSKPGLQSKQGKPDLEGKSGLGMRSMRQRAAIIGARLDFISVSGNGLLVQIEIPHEK
jgi:two-component system NarL family sensor kinase